MKTANQVIAKIVKVKCPYCDEELEGWALDPRGKTEKCDCCGKKFEIALDAEVIVKNYF